MASVGDIIKGVIEYDAPNSSMPLNIFHWVLTSNGDTDLAVLEAVASWAENVWGGGWKALASASCNLVSVRLSKVAPDGTTLSDLGVAMVGLAGTIGSQVMPAAVCGYVMAPTLIPKIRAVKYVPGVAEGLVDDGAFTSTGQLALSALGLAMLAGIATTGHGMLNPGVLSRPLTQFVPLASAFAINSIPAYQRRRKQGVGI